MPPTKRKPASISLYKSHHRVTDPRPDPDEELRIHLLYGPSFLATKSSGVFRATSCLGRLGSPGSPSTSHCFLQDTSPQASSVVTLPRDDTMVLGRLAHYTFDAVLVSAFLAGVKRSTGLTPSLKPDTFSESPGVKKWIENYLWVGETIMDQSVAIMSSSGYFERKR
ncbi:DUF1748-domain-containing protein [Sphaerulina musiva SO2202]|uniref:DUF1748-domain-containing protein n=1 Tax=Sphaerulina musiva (strain SO2202) TaxID=692275 RepID=N1QMQ3_SPHMS|nr:DUF1748-domain-containing protein [Sphaerulina musiva SO2202]EMF17288.1 DUF1748-domain-containing protein [Sphaerulina musiva SO2202]